MALADAKQAVGEPPGPNTASGFALGEREAAELSLPDPPAIVGTGNDGEAAWRERAFAALDAGLSELEWLELCFAELFDRHPKLSWHGESADSRRRRRRSPGLRPVSNAGELEQLLRRCDRYGTGWGREGGRRGAGVAVATELLRRRAQSWVEEADWRSPRKIEPGRPLPRRRRRHKSDAGNGRVPPPVSLAWLLPLLREQARHLRRNHGDTAVDRAARRGARSETIARRVEKRLGAPAGAPRTRTRR
jgi:hypothetical protein